MLDKTRNFKVDCVAYDLEDSVVPSKKSEARGNISRFLQTRSPDVTENAVRINAVNTGLALDDLTAMVRLLYLPVSILWSLRWLTCIVKSAKHRYNSCAQSQFIL